MEITNEVKELFTTIRHQLGEPIRSVQLTDEMLCSLLKVAIGDYAEKVQNWVLSVNWLNVQNTTGFQFQNPADLAYTMTVRSFQWSQQYSEWFSKEVGLQQRGKYELKKDFIKVEKGKQVYIVPKGREINKVMYVTPSTTKASLYGNLGTFNNGIAMGMGQYGSFGTNAMGLQGFYLGSAYDSALLAADLKYKNSFFRGDLAYKVTAGPDGTHLIHLLSVPGSPNQFKGLAIDDNWGWNRYANCYVWYTYYDTGDGNSDAVNECLLENRDDVVITPDQVPMKEMRYELMNYPTQQIIRQLLLAEAKLTLGAVRGMYSGKVQIPDAELVLEYNYLFDQGKAEKEKVMTELKERLDNMTPWKQMENQANMSEQLLKVLKSKPLGLYFR